MSILLAQITNPAVAPIFGSAAAAPSTALASIVVTLWRTAITLGGLALLIMLIIGALEWITAGGDKGKVQAARDRMTQSVIGMLVLAGTVAISVFVGKVLGIDLLNLQFANNV